MHKRDYISSEEGHDDGMHIETSGSELFHTEGEVNTFQAPDLTVPTAGINSL